MIDWAIERIIHFDFERDEFCKDGFVHFGFHDKAGNHYALQHQKHFLGLLSKNGNLKWTVASRQVFEGIPNITAELQFPIYIDSLLDGTLLVSNFGDSRIYCVDPETMDAKLFLDGSRIGMKHAGNCVVDLEGNVWVNEVEGCKIWKINSKGVPLLILGNGEPGFQRTTTDFEAVRFNWIYDIRLGRDGNIYVLDSRNFSIRMIDIRNKLVQTIAGTGRAGYEGDGGDAGLATFGSENSARFDGPISLSLDEEGDIFVGDRFNHVVRMIERKTNTISTIAGKAASRDEKPNDPDQRDPFALHLPKISSMDYYAGQLFVPTDLTDDTGDLIVLRKL